ncbi:hypothetical protein V1509DRAFT_428284 [Lipomyces kononenkoae]
MVRLPLAYKKNPRLMPDPHFYGVMRKPTKKGIRDHAQALAKFRKELDTAQRRRRKAYEERKRKRQLEAQSKEPNFAADDNGSINVRADSPQSPLKVALRTLSTSSGIRNQEFRSDYTCCRSAGTCHGDGSIELERSPRLTITAEADFGRLEDGSTLQDIADGTDGLDLPQVREVVRNEESWQDQSSFEPVQDLKEVEAVAIPDAERADYEDEQSMVVRTLASNGQTMLREVVSERLANDKEVEEDDEEDNASRYVPDIHLSNASD